MPSEDPTHPIDEDRWHRVEALLDEALELGSGERAAFLETRTNGDAELRAEVERMLVAIEKSGAFLQEPIARVASTLITNAEPPSIPTPEVIEHYRIVREIGRGGMGTVYLAERTDDIRQSVALKIVRRGMHLDHEVVSRFLEERRILATLEHSHIARLLDGGITPEGLPWFAMEYVEGIPIDEYCRKNTLDIRARLQLFLDVCDAVRYAHRNKIVHRDLKPANVLVTAEGGVKLLDFGIAKLVASDLPARHLTRTGIRLLTPDYASPEQVRGDAVTPATDVWSLGVMLFQLVTGKLPFGEGDADAFQIERRVLEASPRPPSAVCSEETVRRRVRGDVDAIVLRCLRVEPEMRYATAGELGADVRRHLEGQAVLARGGTRGYRIRTFVRRHRLTIATGAAGVLIGIAMLAVALSKFARPANPSNAGEAQARPVLAVGRIVDYRAAAAALPFNPLAEMLVTNLARTSGLRVISNSRMSELLRHVEGDSDTSAAHLAAARLAGATRIIDGAIYAAADRLRLDLRHVDLATGDIIGSTSITGNDLFALADSSTARLAQQLNVTPPAGSIADITTRSVVAYRLYTEGLARLYEGDTNGAVRLFDAALAEDSTFAMAAFQSARSIGSDWRLPRHADYQERMSRALRLADNASDRERLIIRAYFARSTYDPALQATADTLASRYPDEVVGHLYSGTARIAAGDFAGAVPFLERAVAMDSVVLSNARASCSACEALNLLVSAWVFADSMDAAERVARRGLVLQSGSASAWRRLAEVLDLRGRFAEAGEALRRAESVDELNTGLGERARHYIRAGEFERADRLLQEALEASPASRQSQVRFFQAMSLRNQGRLTEALAAARQFRIAAAEVAGPPASASPSAYLEAQVYLEMGRSRRAAALFDSISRWYPPGEPPSNRAARQVWALMLRASALAQAGETVLLGEIADTVEAAGKLSYLARDHRLHHHIRGLAAAANGQDERAVTEFRSAIYSTTTGGNRTNYELGRLLLRKGNATEAIAALRPIVRGAVLDGSNLHLTLTEIHLLLARAFDAGRQADSALAHYQRVAAAWRSAEPPLTVLRDEAQQRTTGLRGVQRSGPPASIRAPGS
jgi:tetratricopeptide (TPR) repeat protein/TolB-like protein